MFKVYFLFEFRKALLAMQDLCTVGNAFENHKPDTGCAMGLHQQSFGERRSERALVRW